MSDKCEGLRNKSSHDGVKNGLEDNADDNDNDGDDEDDVV